MGESPIGAAQAFVRVGRQSATGLRAIGWAGAAVLIAAAAIIIVAIKSRDQDLVALGLDAAPLDSEASDPDEEAAVAKARSEPSVPWEKARTELSGKEAAKT
jgi:hypothetical protein